ncbi:MAG: hypothetical protein K6A34_03395 [Methanobrevibacter sp.]|nr:hypothetical protein [Methanobrevibacter sp.]
MKFNKGILTVFVLFLILFICLGSAYAQEVPQESGDNSTEKTGVGESNPSTPLNAGEGNYTTLKSEVGSGGNVNLSRSSYKWVDGDGDGTIVITTPGVIDGKGAVIDMQGSLSMRIFDVECGGVTFKNITFKNAFYKDDGGAVYFKENGDLINCSFNGNRAVSCSGGAVFFQEGGNVINCSFDGNRADNSGGAIFCFNVVNVTNCSFTDNYADVGHGGAVCFNEEGSVSGCNFTGNYVKQHRGGAVYFYGSGNVSGCSFTGNYVWNGDGGAVCFNKEGSVSGCSFTGNYVWNGVGDGGAIFFKGTGSVSGCSFNWNRAHSGGAVYFYGSGNVGGCNFMSHIAQNFGGAVYFNGSGNVSGCNFTGNWATMHLGGAVYFNKEGSVSGCNFTLNLAGGNGGAVYFSGYGSSNVSGCNFMLNQAKMDGGAILMSLGSVENCSFYANRADNIGGAVYCGESNVSGCNFMNNYAGNGYGGAFYMDDASLSSVQDSIFINNTQYPIFVYTNEVPVSNSWFGNNATNYDTRPEAGQGVNLLNWLFLNASADSSAVSVFDSSDINFKLYSYNETSSQKILPYDNSRLMPVNLTITSTNGDVNESVINFGESVKYRATNGGRGSVTASIENVACTIGFDNIKIDPNLSIDSPVITYGENGTISLDYNPNATGKVNISLTGKKYNKNYENLDLNATITLSGEILPDEYNVAVKYSGDGNFTNATAFGILTVNYLDSDIKVVGFDINVTDSKALMFRVTLPLNATGILNISNGSSLDVSKSGRKENNTLIIDIFNNAYAVGEYNWTFTYWDDDIYANSSANAVSNILIVKTEIIPLNATIDLYAGSSSKINYTLSPNGFTTDITFSSNDAGVVYVDSISGEIKAISAGSAVISIDFAGNANYTKSNATVTVNVKAKENLTIVATAGAINVGEDAVIVVTGFKNATGNVSASIGSGLYSAIIVNGAANITVSGLNDNVTAFVSYAGDDRYNPADISVNITVYGIIVNAPELTKYYRSSEKFVVNVTDAKGQAISNKSVDITVNGVTYHRTTNAEGTASLSINLNSGEYAVVVAVDDVKVDSAVIVKATIDASDVVKVFRNATQYYATFLDVNGTPTPNVKVSFNINGVIYNRTTDANGAAKLNINLDAGEYILTATNTETGEMKSNIINVISLIESSDLTKYYKNDSQFVVRIHTSDGGYVGAGEEVTFNINGIFYTRTTNATGHAKLNINLGAGNYTVTTCYKDCGRSNNIVVLPVLNTSDLVMKYMDGSQFKAELVDAVGNPYPKQSVDFNINGVLYNRTTDPSGVAKLNIRLMPGVYIITSSFNGCNVANNITVTA